MNARLRIFVMLSLVLVAGQAAAIPTLRTVAPTFQQAGGTGGVHAGLIIEAETDLLVLVIGGGFTITCNTSLLTQTAERVATYSDFFGPREVLLVPEVVPATYSVPGFSKLGPGSCAECVMKYKAQARDETSLSVRVGSTGIGVNFTLIPTGEQSKSNSILTNVCKRWQRQCCTPLCSIP